KGFRSARNAQDFGENFRSGFCWTMWIYGNFWWISSGFKWIWRSTAELRKAGYMVGPSAWLISGAFSYLCVRSSEADVKKGTVVRTWNDSSRRPLPLDQNPGRRSVQTKIPNSENLV